MKSIDPSLQNTVRHEKEQWDKIFFNELSRDLNKKFSSIWWENYYAEITSKINHYLNEHKYKTILEAGSGSGKASLLLDTNFDKTLLDISPNALQFALKLSDYFKLKRPNIVEGDIFSLPFYDNRFDFVWNIGVIEHYTITQIELILSEMTRVCKKGGTIAIGIPNKRSGPILKALLLKKNIFKFIPGYRIDTENFYKTAVLLNVIENIVISNKRKIDFIDIQYFGSPLFMETPKYLFKFLNPFMNKFARKNKFLHLIICKFQD